MIMASFIAITQTISLRTEIRWLIIRICQNVCLILCPSFRQISCQNTSIDGILSNSNGMAENFGRFGAKFGGKSAEIFDKI